MPITISSACHRLEVHVEKSISRSFLWVSERHPPRKTHFHVCRWWASRAQTTTGRCCHCKCGPRTRRMPRSRAPTAAWCTSSCSPASAPSLVCKHLRTRTPTWRVGFWTWLSRLAQMQSSMQVTHVLPNYTKVHMIIETTCRSTWPLHCIHTNCQ